jgi:hypothetical protein
LPPGVTDVSESVAEALRHALPKDLDAHGGGGAGGGGQRPASEAVPDHSKEGPTAAAPKPAVEGVLCGVAL